MPELDDRLRTDARTWQGAVDARSNAHSSELTELTAAPSRRWLGPVLAVAAVLIIAIAGAYWTNVDRDSA
ncbi:MAG: hypothetical protein JWN20_1468, partial [Jatrophihabitantaceae bacterium]|nr:hypothetical protein [Jatrophihabitantaceae bacterium]